MEHIYEHTHDGVTHTHPHTHEHDHGQNNGAARTRALLGYMIDHNDHHASELSALPDTVDGPAREKLREAVAGFARANDLLREALALMEE